ncbi:MAG: arylesterase [Gammaproteobacteria bacterium]|nr:MAG: arylesterase [Gammaproteobacteria bacterium]
MGDSISASHGIEVQQGWATLLQERLEEQNSVFTVENESISGETSAGGLARIDQALDRHKPTLVLLELGANDGLRGLSPFVMKKNLAEMIHRSEQAGAKVLLLGMKIPPNYGKRYIETFFDVYRQLAEEHDVSRVPFLLDGVALNRELIQQDGLHPNARAQPFILENIWPYLLPMLDDSE